MNKFRSGYVTIVGRPNVGKSTLLNHLIGEKLSIISNKPQTTRNTIQAILTKDEFQIVFLDTPGLHKPKFKLSEYMVRSATRTLNEVDVVVFMVTPDMRPGPGDIKIMESLKSINVPVILVINKIDTVRNEQIAKTILSYSEFFKFDEVVPISANKGKNTDKLLETIVSKLPYGPKYFPEDMITDVNERFVVGEIIREKILRNLRDEIPHGTAVDIMQFKRDKETNVVNIDATIYCEKDSHKAILIGKGGQMLKTIGQQARMDIEKFLEAKVYLEVWVKVRRDWRDDNAILKSLGYQIKE